MNKRFSILTVDDELINIQLVVEALKDDYDIFTALSGQEAFELLVEQIPDLILLDVMMPDFNGFEVCKIIKADKRFADIPIIFLTASLETIEGELQGLELGATDYLAKPVNLALLRLRIRNHLAVKERNELVKKQRDLLIRQKEELQNALEYAENIVETVREPMLVLNSELKILTANHNFYNTFKVSPETTIGHFIYDLGNRQWDIPQLRVLLEEILPLETVLNGYEVEHDFPDIGRKTILLNARQIFRKDIGSHIILLAMEDISTRKLAETELRTSRENIERLLQTTDQGIYGTDMSGHCTFINRAALGMTGYSQDECLGKDTHDLIHHRHSDGSHYPVAECPIYRARDEGEGCRLDQEVFWRKDGTPFPVEYSSHPIVTDGETVGAVVTFSNITERRRSEAELHKLSRAVQQSPVTTMITDMRGSIEFVNPMFTELTGYTAEEIIGQNPRILNAGQTPPEVFVDLWTTIKIRQNLER